jgi:hypothetical protein
VWLGGAPFLGRDTEWVREEMQRDDDRLR